MRDARLRGVSIALGFLTFAASGLVRAQESPLPLCGPTNTVTMSVRIARFVDSDSSGTLDRWATQGDFNYVAGTIFDPVGDPPPSARVWIAFEYNTGGSPAQV